MKRDPQELYHQLNERFFEGALPSNTEVKYVDFPGTGECIDTRDESAACGQRPNGQFVIELHAAHKALGADFIALTLAHEMVHILYPVKARDHRAKVWGEEYRRLVGLGFFREIF